MKKENPGGFSFFIGTELRIRVKRGKVKRRHKKIFAGAVYHSDTVASRLRRVNRICSSRVGENCVEVEKWAHTVRPYGRKNPLPFPYSLSSANFAVLSQKETGFKRVETLVSILLPTAVGTANSCAPQSATLRLIKTQKIPQRKPLRDLLCYFSKRFARSYASGAYRSCRRFR